MQATGQRVRLSLLTGLLAFLVVQAVVAVIARCHPWVFRDRFHGPRVRYYHRHLAVQPRPLIVVQLGSSRTGCGLRGKVASPDLSGRLGQPVLLFNMGLAGSGLISNRVNLECLLNDGVRPDLLLLEVLPPSLNEHWCSDFLPERFCVANLRREELPVVERLAVPPRSGLYWEWLANLSAPLHTHRIGLVSSFAPTILGHNVRSDGYDIDEYGWQPFPNVTPERAARQLQIARDSYFNYLQRFRMSVRTLEIMAETIELAKSQGIPVALVVMPEGPTFRSWYPPGVWQQIEKALSDLAKRHDALLINMREALPEEDFMDSHHLLEEGGAKFSRMLAGRIEPMLRQVVAQRERNAAKQRPGVSIQRSAYSIEQPAFSGCFGGCK